MRERSVPSLALLLFGVFGPVNAQDQSASTEELYVSRELTTPGLFTSGIEGPAVDRSGNLYAVNFARQGTVGVLPPGGSPQIFVGLPEGSIANGIRFGSSGAMFLADYVRHNVLKVDPGTRGIVVFAHEPRMNQPNDLAIGANDILYASDPDWAKSTGQLWRIDPDGRVTLLEEGMGTTNGIEISHDEGTLYVAESVQRRIWAYDLSSAGQISAKRLFIRFPDFGLDGMRCDVEGNLYVTRYDKGTVAKVSPSGEVLREIHLVGKKPSNIAFGGPKGRTCYVTLADRGNIEAFQVDAAGRGWKLLQRR